MNENSYNEKENVGRATLVALIIFALGAFMAIVLFSLNVSTNEVVEEASNEATLTIVVRTSESRIEIEDVELESGSSSQEVVNEASESWDFQIKDEIPFDFSQTEFGEELPFDFSQTEFGEEIPFDFSQTGVN
jgi:hypothetical protein